MHFMNLFRHQNIALVSGFIWMNFISPTTGTFQQVWRDLYEIFE